LAGKWPPFYLALAVAAWPVQCEQRVDAGARGGRTWTSEVTMGTKQRKRERKKTTAATSGTNRSEQRAPHELVIERIWRTSSQSWSMDRWPEVPLMLALNHCALERHYPDTGSQSETAWTPCPPCVWRLRENPHQLPKHGPVSTWPWPPRQSCRSGRVRLGGGGRSTWPWPARGCSGVAEAVADSGERRRRKERRIGLDMWGWDGCGGEEQSRNLLVSGYDRCLRFYSGERNGSSVFITLQMWVRPLYQIILTI
jgi:hypothetical protein